MESNYDAQLALHLIRQHMSTSAEGLLYQRDLRTKITTMRIDNRSLQTAFILELHDFVDTYNRLQQNPSLRIDDLARKDYLIAAVAPAPNLASVHTREIEHMVIHGGTGYTYDEYLLLLRTAASLQDIHNGVPRRRIHEMHVEDADPPDYPPDREIFAAATGRPSPPTRVPGPIWDTMSADDRRTWQSLPGTLRTALLGSSTPTRAVNRVTFAEPDDEPPDDPPDDPDDAADAPSGTAQVNQTSTTPSTAPGTDTSSSPTSATPRSGATGTLANAHAGDPRRMLSSRNGRNATRSANVVHRATASPSASDSRWQSAIDDYWAARDVYYDAAEDPSDF